MSVTNTVQSAAGAASATPTTSGRNVIGKDEF